LIVSPTSAQGKGAPDFQQSNQIVLNLNQRQGLSQPSAIAIVQDQLGYIWIGTQAGLNRYDGHRFEQFKSSNTALSGNYIAALCDNGNHQLWVGTRTGLNLYNYKTGRFTSYLKKNHPKIPSDMVMSLSCQGDKIYVGTSNNGFYVVELSRNEIVPMAQPSNLRVHQICHDQQQTFLATRTGLHAFNNLTEKVSQLTTATIKTVAIDKRSKTLVIGQTNGWAIAYTYVNNQITERWRVQIGKSSNKAIEHIILHQNKYLIGTNNGFYTLDLDGKLVSHLKHNILDKNSLTNDIVSDVFVDKAQNVWLGSETAGVSYFNAQSKQFGHINNVTYFASPLDSNDIRFMNIDKKNRFWIATSSGLYIYFDHKFVKAESLYSALLPLENSYISTLLFDNDSLWLSTMNDGMLRLSLTDNSLKAYNNNSPGMTATYNSIVKYQGNIIVASRGNGVLKFDPQSDSFVTFIDPAISQLEVPYHLLVVDDDLWISSMGNGLYRLHEDKLQRLSLDNGSPTDLLYSLTADNKGRVWAATELGIVIINRDFNITRVLNEKDGLADNAVWTLLFDQQQSVWVGSSSGLSQINVNDLSIKNYLPYDGIQGMEYNALAMMLSPDKQVFIGGANGFNQFYPNQINQDNQAPKIVLSDISVLGLALNPISNPELLNTTVEYLKHLTLNDEQDILSFKYSALDHTSQRINYFYRVLGLSDEWLLIPDSLRQFSLIELEPKTYHIEAYAQNSQGLKSEVHRLTIILLSPWWWSPISKSVYLLMSMALIFLFYHSKRHAYQRLQLLVSQRTKQLSIKNGALEQTLEQLTLTQSSLIESEKMAALGSLVAGVAHEINTPLGVVKTGISYNRDAMVELERLFTTSQLTKEQLAASIANQHRGYQLALDNLERAIHLITTFKKVAVDQGSESQRNINLKQYIAEISAAFAPLFKSNRVELSLTGDNDIELTTYPGPLYQILSNLINNSIKHGFDTHQQKIITIIATQTNQTATLIYRDNGVGIAPHIIHQIYQPFITTKRNDGGSGLGMHIVFNLVTQLFDGTIDCQSSPEQGTQFTITFPIVTAQPH